MADLALLLGRATESAAAADLPPAKGDALEPAAMVTGALLLLAPRSPPAADSAASAATAAVEMPAQQRVRGGRQSFVGRALPPRDPGGRLNHPTEPPPENPGWSRGHLDNRSGN